MSIVTQQQAEAWVTVAGLALTPASRAFLSLLMPRVEATVSSFLKTQLGGLNTYTEFYPETPPQAYFDGDELVQGYDMLGGLVVPRLRGDRANATIQLRHTPVRQVLAVYENPAAWATGVPTGDFPSQYLLPTAAYFLDQSNADLTTGRSVSWTGHLVRYSGIWVSDPRCVMVQYVAGLLPNETDPDLAEAFALVSAATLDTIVHAYANAVQRARALATLGPLTSVSLPDFAATWAAWDARGMVSIPQDAINKLEKMINYSRYIGR